jgi:hypothetical protein
MRVIRNIYFWLILGSIAFIGFMSWVSSVHVSQKEWDAMVEEHDGRDPGRIGPFGMGFATACVLGGFWFAVYLKHGLKPSGELRGFVRDHETGELHEDDVGAGNRG